MDATQTELIISTIVWHDYWIGNMNEEWEKKTVKSKEWVVRTRNRSFGMILNKKKMPHSSRVSSLIGSRTGHSQRLQFLS